MQAPALRSPHSPGEAGYNMVVLIVAITVLNILVAAMLPLWSTQIRREKEEELIFRGFQYAEAIRVFQQRNNGSYPIKLEQLIQKPRCIRQLWKDPMTDDGKWSLIFLNEQETPPPDPKGDQGQDENDRPRKGEVVAVGPIIGVRSRSGGKSMVVLFGRERYNEWAFTATLFGGAPPPPPTNQVPGPTGFQLSTRWMGRPMRFLNQQPVPPNSDKNPQ